MGDSPGTGEPGTAPEPSQTMQHQQQQQQPSPTFSHHRPASEHGPDRALQLKRSSLPPRPNGAARHAKRLTLNFPINIPPGAFESNVASPGTGNMTPAPHSAHPSSVPPLGAPLTFEEPDDGSGLLTAIASQERKVLELREELSRAETELGSLKKQWALTEKTKKRTEISHRAEPLVPLRSPDQTPERSHRREPSQSGSVSPSLSQARLSRELALERRHSFRSAANNGTTVSANGRRVFRGSHTRALSLLSPTTGAGDLSKPGSETDLTSLPGRIGRSPRSATLPSSVERGVISVDGTEITEDMISQWRNTMPPPSREALVRTGKQMASDLREGLWTFLEDIRQATVGEEGINATESRAVPPTRTRDSSSTSRSRDRLSLQGSKLPRATGSVGTKGTGAGVGAKLSGKDSKSADIEASFWSEFGIDPRGQKSPSARGASSTPSGRTEPADSHTPDVEDNWDWDSPQKPKPQPQPQTKTRTRTHTPSSSRSTLESARHDQSPMTQSSSPRTSTSFGDWHALHDSIVPDPSVSDGIPWPAITKLAPSKLQRTASNLMAEWERSLSSPPSPTEKDDKRD
ncbi:hypothetical protein BO70DRAFT_327216 [Aspergillus heteromorphus CBS 117.55]|uniref:DUF4048 domain-containing protein n=1 Tax=Aspergillus heteromorphus CBS 117.55 TaxID=1448321 RepID=A0A317X1K8_9EURO|nr:uncharacterized protein BO70DRAFT_327216 [Aspergillus heteromorphus CBS 117.55]PWY92215.1 hypothetical protein BO70DRAFT_327216 [Aspergillus heteromorphus CBS 117.55]